MGEEKCQYAATPYEQLIGEILDSRIPKKEREWAAKREIEALRSQLSQQAKDINRLKSQIIDLNVQINSLLDDVEAK